MSGRRDWNFAGGPSKEVLSGLPLRAITDCTVTEDHLRKKIQYRSIVIASACNGVHKVQGTNTVLTRHIFPAQG